MLAAGLGFIVIASALLPIANCRVAGGTGIIVGSTKRFSCRFQRQARAEFYVGQISKFGVDVGTTSQPVISRAVLAPTALMAASAAKQRSISA
jgi:hypothetical protein